LDKALAARPDDPVALARLALLFEKEGKPDQAISTLESAYKSNPLNVSVLVNLARLNVAAKHSAKAMEYAKAARKLAPDDADVTQSLGRLAYQNGDYQWAFSLLQEAARKQENSPDLMYDLALASYSVGRVADADTAMRSALSLAKAQSLLVFNHADEARQFLDLVALAENPAEATKQAALVAELLKKDPSSVPGLMAAATVSEQRMSPDTARQNYEKVLAVYPDFMPAKLRLALLGSSLTAFDQKTYDWAMQARSAYPSDALLAKSLGIQTYLKGDHARAQALLKESVSSRENDAVALYYLGLAQFQLKDAAAAKSLQRSIDLGLKDEALAAARKTLTELKK
jgi:Flp pilus assembly protein TadD